MGFDYEAGGDLSNGGSWLSDPGTYHLTIVEMQEEPTDKNGNLINNAAFRVACVVCDGTTAGQKDKTTDITFFRPKPTDKNEGAFAKKKIDRFLVAVGLVTEQEVKDKVRKSIDLQQAVGGQFIAKLEKESEDSKFLSLSFADIYHVDDSAVSAIPKDKDCLALLAPSQRIVKQANAPAASTAASKPKQATTAKPATPVAPVGNGSPVPAMATAFDDV